MGPYRGRRTSQWQWPARTINPELPEGRPSLGRGVAEGIGGGAVGGVRGSQLGGQKRPAVGKRAGTAASHLNRQEETGATGGGAKPAVAKALRATPKTH